MARIRGRDIYLDHDDQVYFGDNQEAAMWYDLDGEFHLNHTLSGIAATAAYHLITKGQVDASIALVASGIGIRTYSIGDFLEGSTTAPGIGTAGPITGYLFDDNVNNNLYSTFVVPQIWKPNSNITIKIGYMNDSMQAGTNSVVWRFGYHSYEDGDSYASKSTTISTLTSTLPNNSIAGYFKLDTFPILQYNHANNPFSGGTTIPFQLQRQAIAAGDTLTGDAGLLVLIFLYETEAG